MATAVSCNRCLQFVSACRWIFLCGLTLAPQSSAIMAGMVSMGQLVVSADLINRYTTGTPAPGFPSGSVHTACVFALIAGIWGVVLAFIVPIANRADPLTGVRVNGAMAATQWLLSAFVLDIIR